MALDVYRIPHATSVYVERTQGRGVLHVVTFLSGEEEAEKREMMDAIHYTVPRLGLREYKVKWDTPNAGAVGGIPSHEI